MKRYGKILIMTLCILIISIASISTGMSAKNIQNDNTNFLQKESQEFPLICNINANGIWVRHQNEEVIDEGTFSVLIRKIGKSGLIYGKWDSSESDKTEILRGVIRFTLPLPRADINPFIGLLKDTNLNFPDVTIGRFSIDHEVERFDFNTKNTKTLSLITKIEIT